MIWSNILEWLNLDQKAIFLYVIDSKGSSPGRAGFKMAINEQHEMVGSIGGGFMEHKLIELCKHNLLIRDFAPFIKKQIHKDSVAKDKSGMICSGEQIIAFYQLSSADIEFAKTITTSTKGILIANEKNLQFEKSSSLTQKFESEISSPSNWVVKEDLNKSPELHIIGGGHVSLALSKFAKEINFNVIVYDNRSRLNTMEQNNCAKTVYLEEYSSIKENVPNGAQTYVVIMSFGFKTDKIILKSLLKGNYKYLGMMGSQAKIDTLFKELIEEGISNKRLEKVHAPIGLPINSKTPNEIAISILGQIIQIKNATLNSQGTLV
ncbi:MAG: XdhC family protein [Cyclobacteriaceae bacterium]|nr:XdhC family protein [Cyclobacteriaceae bacterium]